jgi:hypothetical protein
MKRIPGFFAERALVGRRHHSASFDDDRSETNDRLNDGTRVVPASSRYCRRLLKKCLAGDDPRSFACDSWLILC